MALSAGRQARIKQILVISFSQMALYCSNSLKNLDTTTMDAYKDKTHQIVTVYPIWQAAYQTLIELGVNVVKPEGDDPEYPAFFYD